MAKEVMEPITSREYKLMLQASKFDGDDAKMLESAGQLWEDLAGIIVLNSVGVNGTDDLAVAVNGTDDLAVAVSGTDDLKHKRRQVTFFDTEDKWLKSHGYTVRERIDLAADECQCQVTLKFRHPDRYVSQDRNMDPADGFNKDIKFEQDIKPPFQTVYSFSSNTIINKDTPLATLEDVDKIYPGLSAAVDEFPKHEKIFRVNDFTAHERVVKGMRFQIRKDPEISAECSVTIWYPSQDDDKPVLAEFSLKYEDQEELFTAKMARRAYEIFLDIQNNLGAWIDPESKTKTTYVYSRGPVHSEPPG